MVVKVLVSLLFAGVFMQAYSQSPLIGNWRQVKPPLKHRDTTNKQLNWGDLQIRTDSTFHIEGDSASKSSTIPGWHTGNEYNGTWELNKNNDLTLWLEPKEDRMFLWFIIIKLTKDNRIRCYLRKVASLLVLAGLCLLFFLDKKK